MCVDCVRSCVVRGAWCQLHGCLHDRYLKDPNDDKETQGLYEAWCESFELQSKAEEIMQLLSADGSINKLHSDLIPVGLLSMVPWVPQNMFSGENGPSLLAPPPWRVVPRCVLASVHTALHFCGPGVQIVRRHVVQIFARLWNLDDVGIQKNQNRPKSHTTYSGIGTFTPCTS